MTHVIAQLQSVPADALKDFALIIAGLVAIAVGIKQLIVRKPSIDAEFATKSDLAVTDRKIDKLRDDIHEQFTGEGLRSLRSAAELHEKINQVSQDVSFIRGGMDARDKQLGDLTKQLTQLLERTR